MHFQVFCKHPRGCVVNRQLCTLPNSSTSRAARCAWQQRCRPRLSARFLQPLSLMHTSCEHFSCPLSRHSQSPLFRILLKKSIATEPFRSCQPRLLRAFCLCCSSSWPHHMLSLFCPSLHFTRLNLRASPCPPGTATPAPSSADGPSAFSTVAEPKMSCFQTCGLTASSAASGPCMSQSHSLVSRPLASAGVASVFGTKRHRHRCSWVAGMRPGGRYQALGC